MGRCPSAGEMAPYIPIVTGSLEGSSSRVCAGHYLAADMESNSRGQVTRLLQVARDGESVALGELFTLVYEELRAEAHKHRRRWERDYTLNTTAIVHEAYLKLADRSLSDFSSRAHFLCVASKAMRHLLVDYARKRSARKRGGDLARVSMSDRQLGKAGVVEMNLSNADLLVRLDRALDQLSDQHPRQVQVVECRFFGGMSIAETAEALHVATATVKRDWALAQVWLHRHLKEDEGA